MIYFGLAVNLIVMILGMILAGLGPLELVDYISAIIVFLPAFIAPLASYGKSNYAMAFSVAFTSQEVSVESREVAANVFKLMGDVAIGFGWIGVLIGAVAMLSNLGSGDAKAVGIGMAAALITPLYSYIFKYGFCVLAEYKVAKK